MIYTLIKGHTKANNYDGYPIHHHIQLLKMHPGEYLSVISAKGLVFPTREYANLILNPYLCNWVVANLGTVGYGFRQLVDEIHRDKNMYAFGNYHDGIDCQPTDLTPSPKIATVATYYNNPNGVKSTAEIFAVEEKDILQPGQVWIKNFDGKIIAGKVVNGSSYIELPYREAFNNVLWNEEKKLAYWEG
jgi:hypothetical protein